MRANITSLIEHFHIITVIKSCCN